MKIAFAGASSTGKTTLVKELLKLSSFENYDFVTTDARRIITDFNKRKMEELTEHEVNIFYSTYFKQKVIAERTDNFITDRSFADVFCYMTMNKNIQPHHFEAKYKHEHSKYDLVVYFPPNLIKFEDDGHRNLDKSYHDEFIEKLVNILPTWSEKFIRIDTGNLDDRLSFLLSSIHGIDS